MNAAQLLPRLQGVRKTSKGWTARCPAHEDKNNSLSIGDGEKGVVLHCFAGCPFATIVSALHLSPADLMADFNDDIFTHAPTKPVKKIEQADLVEVAVYPYHDEQGRKVYEVVRYEPKTFKQRHYDHAGQIVWGMSGVRRVPYHLPELLKADRVYHCEGEKDADALVALGLTATTTAGGAASWLDAYAEFYEGKEVVILPDQDDAGRKYADQVRESIAERAKNIRVVDVPRGKDVSDYLTTLKDDKRAALELLVDKAVVLTHGIDIPVYNMREMEESYRASVKQRASKSFGLGKWLPSLRQYRNLIPGELVTVLADTGAGKTAAIQCIAQCARPLPVLIFSMELPKDMMFERQMALTNKLNAEIIEKEYEQGGAAAIGMSDHIHVCDRSGLAPKEIERIILQSELKIGVPPLIVIVDYIGLVAGIGKRYERISDAAEQFKMIAKRANVILIAVSQIHRKPGDDDEEIYLHDGKDSGSIENSSGVVLGLWRPGSDPLGKTAIVKVCKCTKGKAGLRITCNFDGAMSLITERFEDRSMPAKDAQPAHRTRTMDQITGDVEN